MKCDRPVGSGIPIREGKIVTVDVAAKELNLTHATVMELAESETILPGLIDLHAHYNLDLKPLHALRRTH